MTEADEAAVFVEWRAAEEVRHCFCSTLVGRGASIEAVRLLAGHSKLATTQR